MDLPSGRKLSDDDIALLTYMHVFGFVRYSHEPFTLASGIASNVYVFGREDLTDHPELLHFVGQKIAWMVYQAIPPKFEDDRSPCLIGLPTAGYALAQAATTSAYYLKAMFERDIFGHPLPDISFRVMREALKKRGPGAHQTWINGQPNEKYQTYWMVDNVMTNGQTKIDAAEKWRESGYPHRPPVIVLVDRCQGALENLRRKGFEQVHVCFNLLDMAYFYGKIGLWPKNVVSAVETEIQEHQLLMDKQDEGKEATGAPS